MFRSRFTILTRTFHYSIKSASASNGFEIRAVDSSIEQRQLYLLKQLENAVRGDTLNKFCGGTIDYFSTSSNAAAPLMIFTHKHSPDGLQASTSTCIQFPIHNKSLETASIESFINANSKSDHGSGHKENNVEKHTNVKAVLNNLSILGRGRVFKREVEAPRGIGHFGSLVVCLPTRFKGGELVLRESETGVEKVVDWSTDEPCSVLKWVAFVGTVEHEVLEVLEGHRVTLTYDLYYVDENLDDYQSLDTFNTTPNPTPSIKMDSTTSVIQNIFSKRNNDPHFAPDGTTLGYFCQHRYSADISESYIDNAMEPPKLLGRDLAFFNAAKSLGWVTEIVPVFDERRWNNWDYESYEDLETKYYQRSKQNLFGREDEVVWLGEKPHRYDYPTMLDDDDCVWSLVWGATVVLVKIPKLKERVKGGGVEGCPS
ncbi:hypothetical protein HDU76_003954 [Blyttiomyces sp. JEL0837]|nr:hypothetical protein HDU76_003954 [Blyttiomyces sp. JEL0837]